MQAKNIFFTLIVVILGFGIWFIYSVGIFKTVEVREETGPSMILLYKEHTGPYHKIIDAISAVEDFAKEKKLSCRKTFGEYLDNPEVVEHDRLRSLGGCVLDLPVTGLNEILPSDIKSKEISEKKYVVAEFYGAPMIGPYKVYPKLDEYFHTHNLKRSNSVLEIYEMVSEKELKTKYFVEISNL